MGEGAVGCEEKKTVDSQICHEKTRGVKTAIFMLGKWFPRKANKLSKRLEIVPPVFFINSMINYKHDKMQRWEARNRFPNADGFLIHSGLYELTWNKCLLVGYVNCLGILNFQNYIQIEHNLAWTVDSVKKIDSVGLREIIPPVSKSLHDKLH